MASRKVYVNVTTRLIIRADEGVEGQGQVLVLDVNLSHSNPGPRSWVVQTSPVPWRKTHRSPVRETKNFE